MACSRRSQQMFPSHTFRVVSLAVLSFLSVVVAHVQSAEAEDAYVRISQVGYEAGKTPFRAFLMSTGAASTATFQVLNSNGRVVDSGRVGPLLGTWSHSKTVAYNVYALDFSAPASDDLYTISVSGPIVTTSPRFAVNTPDVLYSGLLLNTLFFYQTERDGPDFIPNALRTQPGHLKDRNAHVYQTPSL